MITLETNKIKNNKNTFSVSIRQKKFENFLLKKMYFLISNIKNNIKMRKKISRKKNLLCVNFKVIKRSLTVYNIGLKAAIKKNTQAAMNHTI